MSSQEDDEQLQKATRLSLESSPKRQKVNVEDEDLAGLCKEFPAIDEGVIKQEYTRCYGCVFRTMDRLKILQEKSTMPIRDVPALLKSVKTGLDPAEMGRLLKQIQNPRITYTSSEPESSKSLELPRSNMNLDGWVWARRSEPPEKPDNYTSLAQSELPLRQNKKQRSNLKLTHTLLYNPGASGTESGKWMIFVEAEYIDNVWSKIYRAIMDGELGMTAKAANGLGGVDSARVNFEDTYELAYLRAQLRALGFEDTLHFKSDAMTAADISGSIYSK